jgi:hypothetical protein
LLAAVLFPAFVGLAFICSGLLIMLMGAPVFARPQWFYISLAILIGVLIPCVALWLGSLPFLRSMVRHPLKLMRERQPALSP